MRQAGRYLPEYRALRAEKGGFLELVQDPDAAAEVTLQPIRRFGFDGAILFSDILMVPFALGQDLRFEAGEGPRLSPALVDSALAGLDSALERLEPVYRTVEKVAGQSAGKHHLPRFRRQPLDGRDLYGGRPGQQGPGRGATARLRRSRRLPGDRRRHIAASPSTISRARSKAGSRRCNCSTAGPAACRRRSSSAG